MSTTSTNNDLHRASIVSMVIWRMIAKPSPACNWGKALAKDWRTLLHFRVRGLSTLQYWSTYLRLIKERVGLGGEPMAMTIRDIGKCFRASNLVKGWEHQISIR